MTTTTKKQEPEQAPVLSLPERIALHFETLEGLVVKAEQAQQEGKAVAQFIGKLEGVTKFVDGMSDEDAAQIVKVLGVPATWTNTIGGIRAVVSDLKWSSGLDRTEGDASVAQLQAVMTLGWETAGLADETERAETLIARWEATRPTSSGTSTTGQNAGKALGFSVQSKCECGFVRSTSKDNLNSHRYQLQQHEAKQHENTDTARGSEWHKGVTSALSSLMDDKSNHETSGRWTFDQVGK